MSVTVKFQQEAPENTKIKITFTQESDLAEILQRIQEVLSELPITQN